MVSRIQNRNSGHSDNLFSHNPRIDNNTLNSIDGATALKLDESFEIKDEAQNNFLNQVNNNLFDENVNEISYEDKQLNDIPSGVSIESASYIERSDLDQSNLKDKLPNDSHEEEHTPRLFSEDQSYESDEVNRGSIEKITQELNQLFDHDINEEDDFEIPAFLRKQKF